MDVPDLWPDLLACLELTPTGTGTFTGANQHLAYHRIFGGQLLAQFLTAAQRTCPDKAVKSLHAQFVREGSADEPVRYDVHCLHHGRSFATMTMTAHQGAVIATTAVTMHSAEDGPRTAARSAAAMYSPRAANSSLPTPRKR